MRRFAIGTLAVAQRRWHGKLAIALSRKYHALRRPVRLGANCRRTFSAQARRSATPALL